MFPSPLAGDDGPVDELIVAGTAFGTVQLLLSCLSLISFHVFRLRVIQSRVLSPPQETSVSNRITIALFGLIQFCRSVFGIFGFKHDGRWLKGLSLRIANTFLAVIPSTPSTHPLAGPSASQARVLAPFATRFRDMSFKCRSSLCSCSTRSACSPCGACDHDDSS